jgi:hypothetical protein
MIILWIYITGAIAALIMSYYSIYKDAFDYEYFHVGDLCHVLFMTFFSWIVFFAHYSLCIQCQILWNVNCGN